MKATNYQNLITANPQICHGKPIFKGTRIMIWQILELLEAGENSQQIHQAFPSLPKEAIPAALHYAAERAKGTTYYEFTNHDSDHSYPHLSA